MPNWNPKNGGMLISQPVTSCLTNPSELCMSRGHACSITNHVEFLFIDFCGGHLSGLSFRCLQLCWHVLALCSGPQLWPAQKMSARRARTSSTSSLPSREKSVAEAVRRVMGARDRRVDHRSASACRLSAVAAASRRPTNLTNPVIGVARCRRQFLSITCAGDELVVLYSGPASSRSVVIAVVAELQN